MELKFKAWHKPSKQFLTLTGISFHTNELVVEVCGINTIMPMDEFELLQYIWEKDKNEAEIYVGDIYKWEYDYDADYDGDMPIVKTSKGVASVKNIFDRHKINDARLEGSGVEIIGNIYENPELLK